MDWASPPAESMANVSDNPNGIPSDRILLVLWDWEGAIAFPVAHIKLPTCEFQFRHTDGDRSH